MFEKHMNKKMSLFKSYVIIKEKSSLIRNHRDLYFQVVVVDLQSIINKELDEKIFKNKM